LVSAGPDLFLHGIPGQGTLLGFVSDDGLPENSNLNVLWTKEAGPGTVTFTSTNSAQTTATFSTNGIYVLALTGDDGAIQHTDLVEVRVEAASAIQPDNGLVAWWPANESSKDVLNGTDAILVSGATYTTGKVASAFHFDGLNDYIWIPKQTNYDLGSSATGYALDFWVKAPYSGSARALLSWNDGVSRAVTVYQYDAYLYLELPSTNGTPHSFSVYSVFDGTWKHVALSYNRSTGQVRVYINGAQALVSAVGNYQAATDRDLYIGQAPGLSTFSGQVDELSLYNRPLDPQEVYDVYTSGSIGKCPVNENEAPVVYAGPDLQLSGAQPAQRWQQQRSFHHRSI